MPERLPQNLLESLLMAAVTGYLTDVRTLV